MKNTLLVALVLGSLLGCGSHEIGRFCAKTADCSPSYTCFTDVKDGFCSRGCTIEGSIEECPLGSICAPIGPNALVCSPTCNDAAECSHVELTCGALSGSTKKACRTP